MPGSCPELSAHRVSPETAPASPCVAGRWHRVVWSEGQWAVGMDCAGGTWMGSSAPNLAWFSLCIQRDTWNAFVSKKHLLLVR